MGQVYDRAGCEKYPVLDTNRSPKYGIQNYGNQQEEAETGPEYWGGAGREKVLSCLQTRSSRPKSANSRVYLGRLATPAFFKDWVAGGLGFEPRQPESESGVLPLDDPPSGRTLRDRPFRPARPPFQGRKGLGSSRSKGLLILLNPAVAAGVGHGQHHQKAEGHDRRGIDIEAVFEADGLEPQRHIFRRAAKGGVGQRVR